MGCRAVSGGLGGVLLKLERLEDGLDAGLPVWMGRKVQGLDGGVRG